MATLFITEFVQFPTVQGNPIQAPMEPAVAEQTVAIGGASVASAAFNAKTRLVRLHTDAICSVKFGSAPVASATTARLAAGQTEFHAVSPGDKVAVIVNT